MKGLTLIVFVLVLMAGCAENDQERLENFYSIEDIDLPEGLMPEVGGMDFMPDGRLALCFHRGEVMLYNPENKSWKLFAEGLHDPLGLRVLNEREMVVMQRPELTRLKDTNGDEVADEYLTISDEFGMSGNYHEFAFGPSIDKEGNFFISLNCASSGDGIWDEVRGEYNPLGRPGRMYSCVPYRGWVLKVSADGKEVTPWASGFRSPDGIRHNEDGSIYITDNQGDWLGTSKLFVVEKGKHYGHISSLVWRADWHVDPLTLPVDTLDQLREKAAVLFPHNLMANSPTEPVVIPENANFGPFAGQLLIGEMNFPRIMRVMLEKVNGKVQGACVNFLDSGRLSNGNHRMIFGPNGDLWVGSTAYVWAGHQGLQRVHFNGGTPMDILKINALPDGFQLQFTRPLQKDEAENLSSFEIKRYYYKYHKKYGSPRVDEQPVEVKKILMSEDSRSVTISLAEMIPGYVYDITLNHFTSEKGVDLVNNRVFYTLNQVPESNHSILSMSR